MRLSYVLSGVCNGELHKILDRYLNKFTTLKVLSQNQALPITLQVKLLHYHSMVLFEIDISFRDCNVPSVADSQLLYIWLAFQLYGAWLNQVVHYWTACLFIFDFLQICFFVIHKREELMLYPIPTGIVLVYVRL